MKLYKSTYVGHEIKEWKTQHIRCWYKMKIGRAIYTKVIQRKDVYKISV